ncbi:hypothetical protein NGC36_24165 [Serratia rubidaea]|uniref:hypothetical protein n=1 Tax=Serratia rubidaea TaxID=61652 RepID=UPI002DB8BFA2|nr:hypothetical protein [Serratia rubidaea]MEB7588361.1 hypothetical protein [Serratia rubidaea]
MFDWFITPACAKVVEHNVSLLPQAITALTSAIGVVGGVWLGHRLTRQREERTISTKQDAERLFIATELVFLLEQFTEDCAKVTTDRGEPNQHGEYTPVVKQPELNTADISGDWRTLPPLIMYRIRELPVLQNEARRNIAAIAEHSNPPEHAEYFHERQYQYAYLGLRALILSRRLRKLVSLPSTRLDATAWSAQPVLWQVWRQERHRRTQTLILRKQELAVFQFKNQMRDDSRKDPHPRSDATM